MSKCRYDLSADCNSNDCLLCILDKIKAEIAKLDIYYDNDYFSDNKDAMFKCNEILRVLDKYKIKKEK